MEEIFGDNIQKGLNDPHRSIYWYRSPAKKRYWNMGKIRDFIALVLYVLAMLIIWLAFKIDGDKKWSG